MRSAGPVDLLGLSESFTVGMPLALVSLQTRLMGSKVSSLRGWQSRKSLVKKVPQPAEKRMRPSK